MDKFEEFISVMENKISKYIKKKNRFYFIVSNENLHSVIDYLYITMGCRLSTATAIENYDSIEVLYHFSHDNSGNYFCPRILMMDKAHPQMNSITPIVKGAEWIEREMSEMYGIDFEGHPRKEPLLTGNHPRGLRQPLRITKLS